MKYGSIFRRLSMFAVVGLLCRGALEGWPTPSAAQRRRNMKNTLPMNLTKIGCAILLATLPALGQEHKWAGRTLDGLEWRIHEELAMLPFHGVFDTLRLELRGKTVTLFGQVVRDTVKITTVRLEVE